MKKKEAAIELVKKFIQDDPAKAAHALEGLPLTVDLDNGRAWFGRQIAAQRAADLIAARARGM